MKSTSFLKMKYLFELLCCAVVTKMVSLATIGFPVIMAFPFLTLKELILTYQFQFLLPLLPWFYLLLLPNLLM